MEVGKCVGWDWDVRTGHDRWFGDLQTMFGMQSDTYYGHIDDFRRRVHPEDQALVWNAVTDARRSRKPFTAEFRILRLDGTVRWMTERGQFYYAANGDAVRMLGMAVDITERKQAEEALKKSEEKFSKAFRESPMALAVTRMKDDRYIDVNDTYEQMTGWRREEIIGRTPFDLKLWVDPTQRTEMAKEIQTKGTGSEPGVPLSSQGRGAAHRLGVGRIDRNRGRTLPHGCGRGRSRAQTDSGAAA